MLFPSCPSCPSCLSCLLCLFQPPRGVQSHAGRGEAHVSPTGSPTQAQASGLVFTHFNGMSGHFYYPEIMAPGVALLDYDNDGDLDVYVTQGQMLGVDGKTLADGDGTPAAQGSSVSQ